MGEVIDINIISYKKDIIERTMCFMEELFEMHNVIQNIEVMDNWCYENVFNLSSLEETKEYMDSKIITLTRSSLNEQIGVSLERIFDCYCYQFWYNPKQELSDNICKEIYGKYVIYILNKLKYDILMCGIGREISIDFGIGIDEIIKDSHNVDIWIIQKNIYEKCRLKNIIKENLILI